jgi:hypothetical protein
VNESVVEVSKAEEGLNILHFAWFRPILDCLDFGGVHTQTRRRQDITEVLNRVGVESAFVDSGIEAVLSESSKYFAYMFSVKLGVVRVDEDIVEIDDNTNIEHVGEDVVHKSLERRRGVGKSERHDLPFKRSVAGSECGLPLITFGYAD